MDPGKQTGRSGRQNATAPEGAQSVRTLDRHVFLTKNVCEKKTSKNTLQGGTAVSGCQNGTVPEQGEIHLAYSLFANFIENDFKTKLRKIRLSEVPQFRGAKMARSQCRAKSTYPIASLQISLNTILKQQLRKIRFRAVPKFLGAKMARSRRRAKSTYPLASLQISLKTIFK